MAEYSVRVSSKVGCLEKIGEAITKTGANITSAACACPAGADGFATFSLSKKVKLDIDAQEGGFSVLNVHVRNEAGCLAQVTSALGQAGVNIGSLACACGAGDLTGTVSVGLRPRG
jgi:uncharacterized protein with ACT and thioredoxin-like domain